MTNQNIFAMSFPVLETEFPANVVCQGHIDYCAANGHATHTVDGVLQGFCPRCGTVTTPANNTERTETKTMFDANTHEELTDSEMEDAYDEWLDCDGAVQVAGLSLYPSTIIKECDPIAYRVGKSDFESFMLDDGEWLEELPEEEEEEIS